MESQTENKNDGVVAVPPVVSAGGGGPAPVIAWSKEFECEMVDGVLSPSPISSLRTTVGRPESSGSVSKKRRHGHGHGHGSSSAAEGEHESKANQSDSSKRKRIAKGTDDLFFKLFKFEKPEEYLLEMHEAKTGRFDRSHVIASESNVKWKIGASDLAEGSHCVVPVLEDPSPLRFPKKYQLTTLQERLVGWTVEKRRRTNGNGKEDTFYYHRGRQFRSFVEVTAFILYSCKLKDLNTSHQNSLEEEVAEAMMIISSSGNNATEPATAENNEKPAELQVDGNVEGGLTKPDELDQNQFMDFVSDMFVDDTTQ